MPCSCSNTNRVVIPVGFQILENNLYDDKKFFIYVGYRIDNDRRSLKYCNYFRDFFEVYYFSDINYYTIIKIGEVPRPLLLVDFGYVHDNINCFHYTQIDGEVNHNTITWEDYCNWLINQSQEVYYLNINLFQLTNISDGCILGCDATNNIQVYQEIYFTNLDINESLIIRVYQREIPYICNP